MNILGIDIGGSGIKGAVVDTDTGKIISDRIRIKTPKPATIKAIGKTINEIRENLKFKGNIACGFPAVVKEGVVQTASNIHKSCINADAEKTFSKITKSDVKVLNDADAAGLAEIKFGAGKDCNGTILVLTIGTGIGSALFSNKTLVPNSELGHIRMQKNLIAEKYTSDAVRKSKKLSISEWAKRLNEYFIYIEKIVNPDLIIIGGGASKKFNKLSPHFTLSTAIKPAELLNNSGIIGATLSVSK